MEFGVPKEVRTLQSEMRVGLTPAGVKSLVRVGHTVYVEKGAGNGAGFNDEVYRDHGAQIVYSGPFPRWHTCSFRVTPKGTPVRNHRTERLRTMALADRPNVNTNSRLGRGGYP